MLKASIVQKPETILEVIHCAEDLFGEIDLMEDYNFDSAQAAEYIKEQCWLITFHEDILKAFVILEWIGKREVNIHFCYLFSGPFRKGWKLFIELVKPHINTINAIVENDKTSVIRIAQRIGFTLLKSDSDYTYLELTL